MGFEYVGLSHSYLSMRKDQHILLILSTETHRTSSDAMVYFILEAVILLIDEPDCAHRKKL
jgi:hypothetical protein